MTNEQREVTPIPSEKQLDEKSTANIGVSNYMFAD